MTDPTYPLAVLAWHPTEDPDEPSVLYQHESGQLTISRDLEPAYNDQRLYGWTIDTRVALPQSPPEPEREPGWYLARFDLRTEVHPMQWDGKDWRNPGGRIAFYLDDWSAVAPLTPEQVEAIEAAL